VQLEGQGERYIKCS